MMRKLVFFAAVVCIAFASGTAVPDIVADNDEDVKTIAEPVLDNIFAGFKTSNYSKYSRDFSKALKGDLSEEKFLATIKQIKTHLGENESRQYLGFLNREGMTLVLWKSRFEKTDSDILIKLTLSKNGRKNEVEGLYFQ